MHEDDILERMKLNIYILISWNGRQDDFFIIILEKKNNQSAY